MKNWKNVVDIDMETGEITAGEIAPHETGAPASVYAGLVYRYVMPHRRYDEEELIEWFAETFEEEIKQLREGFQSDYKNGNLVRVYEDEENSDLVTDADCKIQRRLEDYDTFTPGLPGLEIWDADDWYSSGQNMVATASDLEITAETSDDELEKIANDEQESTASYDRVWLENVYEYLDHVRDHMIDLRDDQKEKNN